MMYEKFGHRMPGTSRRKQIKKVRKMNKKNRERLQQALQMNEKDRKKRESEREKNENIPWNSVQDSQVDKEKDIFEVLRNGSSS